MVTIEALSSYEALRMQAVEACGILGTEPEVEYDRIVFTAAQLLRAPMAMLAIVGVDKLWLKAHVGPLPQDWPRSLTFCNSVAACNDSLVVEDASIDATFYNLPCVADDPFIRFYMGMPLRGLGRYVVGTLCVLDVQPRVVTRRTSSQLLQLACEAEELLTFSARKTSLALM